MSRRLAKHTLNSDTGQLSILADLATYQLIFETLSEGVALNEMIVNDQGEMIDYRVLKVNKAFYEISDVNKDLPVIGALASNLYGLSQDVIKQFWLHHRNATATTKQEFVSPITQRCFHISTSPFIHGQFVTSFHDITDGKRAEENLKKEWTRAQGYLNTVETIIIALDCEGHITTINRKGCQLVGASESELIGKLWYSECVQQPHGIENELPRFLNAMAGKMDFGEYHENSIVNRKNEFLDIAWHNALLHDEQGKVTGMLSAGEDITQRKTDETKIKHLAFYDSLTQLPNRRLMLDRLEHALLNNVRHNKTGALLFIDLDDFKNLNDTLGHEMGDLLIQQAAKRIQGCLRTSDTVARFGGDEFLVMIENMSCQVLEAAKMTEEVGEKILLALSQPYQLAAHEHHSTSSIGITLFNRAHIDCTHKTIEELIRYADIAMYQAKKAGRNTLRFFDLEMQKSISDRVGLESELRKAIANNQFRLHYQIQVDAAGKAVGAEALIRWLHPERGMIPPLQFIPLAEESRLIIPIGHWVLEQACAQLKKWQSIGAAQRLTLAVNVSAKQFRQASFVEQVDAAVKFHQIDPKLLKLELTETLLMDNVTETIVTMNRLSEIGVELSLDDFGTGYSSLQYLKRLPLKQLKIDRSFVHDIAEDYNDRVIVRTIVAMAQSMGMNVIAEGVETEEQKQLLINEGCTNYQGYLFGKPTPIEQFLVDLEAVSTH